MLHGGATPIPIVPDPDPCYGVALEKTIQRFASFAEADRADASYYRALTPQQRLDLLLELVRQGLPDNETGRRLERVYRIVKLAES